jgi:hypothetical protein
MHIVRQINNVNPNGGPVSVVFRSGYATQGAFALSLTDGNRVIPVGQGTFGDTIPDVFTIPIPANELENYMLVIFATYASAVGHNQVSVDYDFYQQGNIIDTEPIHVVQNSISTHHDFTF